jgi:hypothetical protein
MIRDDENGGQPTGDEAKHYELAWGPPGEPLDETYRYSLWFTSPSPSSDTFLLSLDSVTHRWFVCLPDPEGEVDNNGDEKKRNNAATPLVLFPRNRVESVSRFYSMYTVYHLNPRIL